MTHLARLLTSTKSQDCEEIAKKSWCRSSNKPFHQKSKYLAADLKKWRRTKPKLSDQLASVEDRLLQEQSRPPNQQDFALQSELADQHHQLQAKDEQFHLQRAKKNWAIHGDRNTTYFHQAIVKRTRKNRIAYLKNLDGTESTTPDQLSSTLMTYFQNIFSTTTPATHNNDACLPNQLYADSQDAPTQSTTTQQDHITNNATAQQPNDGHDAMTYTNSIPSIQELHAIIKNMRSNASPRPDGLNAAFFKSAWP